MDSMLVRDYLASEIRSAWQPPFRGQIYEYARKLDLQNGYAVKGSFDIETARHLIEPLEAIHDPYVRLMSAQGAVQTLKSLIADITVPYWIEHDPGDILWLFEDDPKAKLYAESRAMPLIRSIPEIARMLEDVEDHEKTKTKIRFKHMNLVIAGMNEGNVQSISYRYVIIDELWMHRSDGLVRQAKDRTKQYADTKKILLLGQGGIEDDDADLEHKKTDRRELHWACPQCNRYQPFALDRERSADHQVKKLRGTVAGLSWDINERTKPGGRWNYEEVGKTAHHRCYYCDFRIEDTPEMRRRLNDSYRYFRQGEEPPRDAHKLPALPRSQAMGFHWPAEASQRVPFAELVRKYLQAKANEEDLGYRLPLREYWQKDRGLSWSENAGLEFKQIVHEVYDVEKKWEEEKFRFLIIDCQKDLQKFFYHVHAVSLSGESRQLARGTAGSWDELGAVQGQWGVRDQHVFVDCGYRMTQVLRECVKRGHVGQVRIQGKIRKVWLCWTGLKGSGWELFRHINPRTKQSEWRIFSERKFYDTNEGTANRQPRSPWYEWSNLHCKDLARSRRDGEANVPKMSLLPEKAAPGDVWSQWAQLRSEKRIEDYKNGRKRSIWVPIKESLPNHDWDICNMLMAIEGIVGIIGGREEQPGDQPAE
jgi:hypothetical protein